MYYNLIFNVTLFYFIISFIFTIQINDERMWLSVREDYTHSSELCTTLNKALGYITLLILVNNSISLLSFCYYSIKYIYRIIRDNSYYWKKLFYYYSIPSMLLEIICVCFCAAEIEIQNTKFLNLLISTPPALRNKEV